jgi:hypothetical protein
VPEASLLRMSRIAATEKLQWLLGCGEWGESSSHKSHWGHGCANLIPLCWRGQPPSRPSMTPQRLAWQVAAVQLHLLTTSIMMLSREGFRRGCQRFRSTAGEPSPSLDKSGSTATGSRQQQVQVRVVYAHLCSFPSALNGMIQ